MDPQFLTSRIRFHANLLASVLRISESGVASNADSSSAASKAIAAGIYSMLGAEPAAERMAGQSAGQMFESICEEFLKDTFTRLQHLRPGNWDIRCVNSRNASVIAQFEQYEHIVLLQQAAKRDRQLAAALQSDYTIAPDLVIARQPCTDKEINKGGRLVNDKVAIRSSLRASATGKPLPILHASVSCKWTIRSDRAQNARSEALNLIRNRKGNTPHIVVVTGEPLPSRIASIALGTGDIDCVYHFALDELLETVKNSTYEDAYELLQIMVEGKRLKDISDLPLDLAI